MNRLQNLLYGPMTRDRCEVCGKRLRVRQRLERTFVGLDANGMGGWSVTATYCKKDAS